MAGASTYPPLIRSLDNVGKLMSNISLVLMMLLAVLITYDAIMRSFGYPSIWVFETTLYAFIFLGFLGNALALKKGAHFRVTFLLQIFPKTRKFFNLLSHFSVLFFGFLLIGAGLYFTWYSWSNSIASSTLLEVPLWIPNLAIPLGGLGLVLQTIVNINSESLEHVQETHIH